MGVEIEGGQRGLTPMPCTRPQLTNKIVFVVSFVGNRGTFIRGYKARVMDVEFLYHVGSILTSVLGLFAHELFYSILVRPAEGQAGGGAGQLGPCRVSCSWPCSTSLCHVLLLLGLLLTGPQGSDGHSWPLSDPSPLYGAGLSLDSGTSPS